MHAYGDESGHLRNLLTGNSAVFVLAVVAGDEHACGACPKRAVRRTSGFDEAKWIDMTPTQKRRAVDCLTEDDRELRFAYGALLPNDLTNIENGHLLHQNRAFSIDWDLAVIGLGYTRLLHQIGVNASSSVPFTFDRLFGTAQSDEIVARVRNRLTNTEVRHATSHSAYGIQAADCVAGAIAEQYRGGSGKWAAMLEEQSVNCSRALLTDIEKELQKGE